MARPSATMRRALNARLAAQAAAIKVSANIVVQLIARWHKQPPGSYVFDWQQVIEFGVYGSFNSQLSNVVQFILEDWFPTAHGTDELSTPIVERSDGYFESVAVPNEKDLARFPGQQQLQNQMSEKAAFQPPQDAIDGTQETTTERIKRLCGVKDNVIWRHLFAKLILDQTLGLMLSGCVFLTFTNILRVPHPLMVLAVIRERIFSLLLAGWHLWPLVALCNFLWVPVRSRVLVAVFVGFGWSIFLSVFAMRK